MRVWPILSSGYTVCLKNCCPQFLPVENFQKYGSTCMLRANVGSCLQNYDSQTTYNWNGKYRECLNNNEEQLSNIVCVSMSYHFQDLYLPLFPFRSYKHFLIMSKWHMCPSWFWPEPSPLMSCAPLWTGLILERFLDPECKQQMFPCSDWRADVVVRN